MKVIELIFTCKTLAALMYFVFKVKLQTYRLRKSTKLIFQNMNVIIKLVWYDSVQFHT